MNRLLEFFYAAADRGWELRHEGEYEIAAIADGKKYTLVSDCYVQMNGPPVHETSAYQPIAVSLAAYRELLLDALMHRTYLQWKAGFRCDHVRASEQLQREVVAAIAAATPALSDLCSLVVPFLLLEDDWFERWHAITLDPTDRRRPPAWFDVRRR